MSRPRCRVQPHRGCFDLRPATNLLPSAAAAVIGATSTLVGLAVRVVRSLGALRTVLVAAYPAVGRGVAGAVLPWVDVRSRGREECLGEPAVPV